MICGFLLVCLVILIGEQLRPMALLPNEAPTWDPFTLSSLTLDAWLWPQNVDGYFFTNYLLRALVTLLVALTTLELTGLTGNRGGGAPAVWAALLFAVSPNAAISLFTLSCRPLLFGALFFLSALFLVLRYRLTAEKWQIYSSLLVLVFFLGSVILTLSHSSVDHSGQSSFLPQITPASALLEASGLAAGRMPETILPFAFAFSVVIFFVRLSKGWLAKEGLITALCLAVTLFVPFFCSSGAASVLVIYLPIFLSMLLPFLALPIMDRADERDSRYLAICGMLVLITVFLCWLAIFEDQSSILRNEAVLPLGRPSK